MKKFITGFLFSVLFGSCASTMTREEQREHSRETIGVWRHEI